MHVPCPHCGSSDAGWRFDDGGAYCYKCGRVICSAGQGAPPPTERKRMKPFRPLEVEIKAIPNRKLSQATCEKWGYGFADFHEGRVHVAQFYDPSGVLCGQKVRTAGKEFLILGDLKPAGLYGQHLWRDGGKMVVVTEGEIDALSVSQAQGNKWPVVSLPNGAQSAKSAIQASIEWLEKFERVVLMFDMDAPGQKAAREAALVLSPGKAFIAQLPLKDANEVLVAGRAKDIVDAIWGAKVFRPDGVVTGEDMWAHMTGASAATVLAFPHSGLNAKTMGMREGELVTLVAGTGTGKSTLCREIAGAAVAQGVKTAYIALEEDVRRSVLGLLTVVMNKPLHLLPAEDVDMAAVRAEFDKIKDRVAVYDHFGSLAADNLLGKIRYMILGLGCKFVVLDHLSIVVSGMDLQGDERRTLDYVMTQLASLAQETKACILLVCHLRRPEKGAAHEEGRPVTLADLRGSGAIAQLSHTVVSLERDQQNEETKDLCDVRSLKCRHTGNTGLAGKFIYDRETGRLKEHGKAFDFSDESGSGDESDL
jgi:twinkle protein